MEEIEIIRNRHSVRQYQELKIEEPLRKKIDEFVTELNRQSGLSLQPFYDEPKCFNSFLAHYGKFENVTNYIVVIGSKGEEEKAGYFGEKLF